MKSGKLKVKSEKQKCHSELDSRSIDLKAQIIFGMTLINYEKIELYKLQRPKKVRKK